MRERVTIQRPVTALDAGLGRAVTWATVVADVWASVTEAGAPEESHERLDDRQITSLVAHTVTVWYQAALAEAGPTWRVLWSGKVLEVARVSDPEQRHETLRFMCREVQV